jgi:hypothetical protein
MDLFDKAKEIIMTSLLILYNTNLVPLADLEQQRSSVEEELQEVNTSILVRRKKNRRKVVHEVVIKEMNMKVGSGNLSILRSF